MVSTRLIIVVRERCDYLLVYVVAARGNLETLVQQAEINLMELMTELLRGHELVVLPVSTNDIATLN
jgi:hypothetical protein